MSANTFGIHVDNAGRIAIGDTPSGGGVIYTYDPPKKGSLGNPVSTTQVTGGVFYFAFQATGRDLYTPAYINSRLVIGKYDYPMGGPPEKTITLSPSSNPYGVAVTPPLIP